MSEKENINNQEQDDEKEKTEGGASAETEKTDKSREGFIPRDRFDEINEKNKELKKQLEQVEADKKAETEKRLADQENWKELADKRGADLAEAQAKADKVAAMEETLQGLLDAQIEMIPEEYRSMVPEEYTPKQKIDWISQNQSILTKAKPFDIGAGKRGGEKDKEIVLSAEERESARKTGVTPEEYANAK